MEAFEEELLLKINDKRKKHGSPNLLSCRELSQYAHERAVNYLETKYVTDENVPDLLVGENVFFRSVFAESPTASEILSVWYREHLMYNFDKGEYEQKTQNFVQLVWRDSKYFGLGYAKRNNKFCLVACFFPSGNVPDKFWDNVFTLDTEVEEGKEELNKYYNTRRHMLVNLLFVAAHNYLRKAHKAPPLVLTRSLAKYAKKRVKYISTNWPTDHVYGENLYIHDLNTGYRVEGTLPPNIWYSSFRQYTYMGNHEPQCKEFTQLVWKNTTQLGLGYKVENNFLFILGCYYPKGNILGEFLENVLPRQDFDAESIYSDSLEDEELLRLSKANRAFIEKMPARKPEQKTDILVEPTVQRLSNEDEKTNEMKLPKENAIGNDEISEKVAESFSSENILHHVNEIRTLHGSPPLLWNEDLAAHAKDRAELMLQMGEFANYPDNLLGENVFYWNKELEEPTCEEMLLLWHHDRWRAGAFPSHSCKECGTCTQLIWINSKYMGVGYARKAHRYCFVGCFFPRGNIQSELNDNVLPWGTKAKERIVDADELRNALADLVYMMRFLNATNSVRKAHKVSPVILSRTLTKFALRRAKETSIRGSYMARPDSRYGESYFSNPVGSEGVEVTAPLKYWYAGIKYYDFETGNYVPAAKDFMQLMCQETNQMGFGYRVHAGVLHAIVYYHPKAIIRGKMNGTIKPQVMNIKLVFDYWDKHPTPEGLSRFTHETKIRLLSIAEGDMPEIDIVDAMQRTRFSDRNSGSMENVSRKAYTKNADDGEVEKQAVLTEVYDDDFDEYDENEELPENALEKQQQKANVTFWPRQEEKKVAEWQTKDTEKEQGSISSDKRISFKMKSLAEEFGPTDLLNLMNEKREMHGAPPLQWNDELAQHAKDSAELIATRGENAQHADNYFGENIFYWNDEDEDELHGARMIREWHNEGFSYNYDDDNEYFKATKCFSQLLWVNSKFVGVGFKTLDEQFICVAYFFPRGNIKGKYQTNVLSKGTSFEYPANYHELVENARKDLVLHVRFLNIQNDLRKAHGVPIMVLTTTLMKYARARINKIVEDREYLPPAEYAYGENFFTQTMTAEGIEANEPIMSWYNGIKFYDFEKAKFSYRTHKFTQLIWKTTTQLGFAFKTVDNIFYLIACYNPKGNLPLKYKENVLPKLANYEIPYTPKLVTAADSFIDENNAADRHDSAEEVDKPQHKEKRVTITVDTRVSPPHSTLPRAHTGPVDSNSEIMRMSSVLNVTRYSNNPKERDLEREEQNERRPHKQTSLQLFNKQFEEKNFAEHKQRTDKATERTGERESVLEGAKKRVENDEKVTTTRDDEPRNSFSIADEFDEFTVLSLINEKRHLHGSPPLILHAELSDHALSRAEETIKSREYMYCEQNFFGENIYQWDMKSGEPSSKDMVSQWYYGNRWHDFSANTHCIHSAEFTQLVWADSKYLGLAYVQTGNRFCCLACFHPRGNIPGKLKENVFKLNTKEIKKEVDRDAETNARREFVLSLGFLNAHNRYRKDHGVPPMILTTYLNKHARTRIKEITASEIYEPNDDHIYGENIYTHQPIGERIESSLPVDTWYNTREFYDFWAATYVPEARAFTQMVWKNSTQLGLGYNTVNNVLYVVGCYYPKGNIKGKFASNVTPPHGSLLGPEEDSKELLLQQHSFTRFPTSASNDFRNLFGNDKEIDLEDKIRNLQTAERASLERKKEQPLLQASTSKATIEPYERARLFKDGVENNRIMEFDAKEKAAKIQQSMQEIRKRAEVFELLQPLTIPEDESAQIEHRIRLNNFGQRTHDATRPSSTVAELGRKPAKSIEADEEAEEMKRQSMEAERLASEETNQATTAQILVQIHHPLEHQVMQSTARAAVNKVEAIAAAKAANEERRTLQSTRLSAEDCQQFNKEFLKAANRYRVKHGVPLLEMNDKISEHATAWAQYLLKHHIYEFRTPNDYGESLYKIAKLNIDGADPVHYWYAESQTYNYEDNRFQRQCSNFTQLIWRNTKQVGLGVARDRKKTIVVVNYYPKGNYIGMFADNVLPSVSQTQLVNDKFMDFENDECWEQYTRRELKKFQNDMLLEHNFYRMKHGVPALSINEDLTAHAIEVAQHYAEGGHITWDTVYGINSRLIIEKELKADETVDFWYMQGANYSYRNPNRSIGNYQYFTQIVWKSTTELGVGVARKGVKTFIVAMYNPKGNIPDQFLSNVFEMSENGERLKRQKKRRSKLFGF